MKFPRFFALCLLILLGGLVVPRSRLAGAPEQTAATTGGLRIDPAKTGVPFGSARLVIEPLARSERSSHLSAGYKVEISPFASKSEAGQFSVAISEADLRRLAGGQAIHFAGEAVSQDGANTSEVQGRASPTRDTDGGEIRLQIAGKKGQLIFHSTYHLAPP